MVKLLFWLISLALLVRDIHAAYFLKHTPPHKLTVICKILQQWKLLKKQQNKKLIFAFTVTSEDIQDSPNLIKGLSN